MSKVNSNHFNNTVGATIALGVSSLHQKKKVVAWAKRKADELEAKSKRQRDKFKTACVAFDEETGRYFYGRNGGINKEGSNVQRNLLLFGRDGIPGILPKESLNGYPTPWNCAETDAINKALNAGSSLENLHIYTIDTTRVNFGKDKSSCANCTWAYKGRIKRNNTGWEY